MEKFQIIYSGDVRNQLKEVVSYLEIKWGVAVAESFLKKYEVIIKRLSANPKTGKIAKKDNSTRSLLVTKHNRLYYYINKDMVMLLQLFDTRQNPSKNKFE